MTCGGFLDANTINLLHKYFYVTNLFTTFASSYKKHNIMETKKTNPHAVCAGYDYSHDNDFELKESKVEPLDLDNPEHQESYLEYLEYEASVKNELDEAWKNVNFADPDALSSLPDCPDDPAVDEKSIGKLVGCSCRPFDFDNPDDIELLRRSGFLNSVKISVKDL